MRYATKDDLVDLFGEAKSKYGTLDPNGGLKRTGNALSVDYSEVASVDALEEATALSPTGGIVSTQDGLAISTAQQTTGAIDGALLELTAKSKPATQVSTTGKNLLTDVAGDWEIGTIEAATGENIASPTRIRTKDYMTVVPNQSYVLTRNTSSSVSPSYDIVISAYNDSLEYIKDESVVNWAITNYPYVWTPTTATKVKFIIRKHNDSTSITPSDASIARFQLELGSTATPYEPYSGGAPSPSPDYPQPIVTVTGHEVTGKEGRFVSLERRDSQGTLLDTTPIPLPSRGWVAGLPDGTADELSVDGAGKVVWELWARMLELDGSETYAYVDKGSNLQARLTLSGIDAVKPESGIPRARVICDKMSSEVMSNFDSIINNAFVFYASNVSLAVFNIPINTTFADYVGETSLLYPLATPVTETCGYIDLPDMQDCVLSIPELDALGVRYTIGDGAEIARQWYARAMAELEDTQDAIVDLAADVTALDGRVTVTERRLDVRGTVYGFHVDSNESDSTACVTYLADALGKTPAHMDYTGQQFDYGSWEDAFFMPRPCMLKYDGTVDYYLDPIDYSKKLDGTASDVADPTYAGNAMMEWGRDGKIIWYKVVPDADPTSYSVYIADNQVDDAYVCYPFVNGDGDIVKHFYTPCYFGSIINDGTNDVLRSLSGQLGSARCKNKTATVERTMAKANNPTDVDIWDTEVYADVILVNLLLTLISKSLDSQTAFGQGLHISGTDAINDGFTSGVHDTKGLFWGTNSGAAATYSNAVKVFGMENWWGFMWRRFAGLVAVNGTEKYKLTRGTHDGSTATDYAIGTTAATYDGYLAGGTLPSASGSYIRKQELRPDGSYTPTVVGSSASTYYRDALWTNLNAVTYAYRGGSSDSGARVGAWYLALHNAASLAAWSVGAAPSCKPQSPQAAMASRIKKLEQAVAELVAGA